MTKGNWREVQRARWFEQQINELRIEREWFMHGWTAALEMAARRLETANDETSKKCIAQAIRDLTP
jgi:hypothetical protein